MKRKRVLSFATTWKKMEDIMLRHSKKKHTDKKMHGFTYSKEVRRAGTRKMAAGRV
jgi:hypothetical protein